MPQKQYNPAIDVLRFISILAVVLIHTTTREIESVSLNVQKVPWSLFLNQISRFAVPLFFMISGFVLELSYSNNSSYWQYLKKRMSRIFIPYLFWSFIYYYFVYTKHTISFGEALALGSSSYQLYFIPTILIFYLIFPLLHKFYSLIANKWVLALLGIFEIFVLYQDYYIKPHAYFYPVTIALLNYYVFVLGIVASHHKEKIVELVKKWKLAFFFGTIAVATYVFYQGFSIYIKTHNYFAFYSQWRPSILIYTILLGSVLYYFLNKNQKGIEKFKTLSRLSFFVFFIHVIILEFVWYKIGINVYRGQIWFDYAFFLVVAGISFTIAFIVHKIPLLSKLTG